MIDLEKSSIVCHIVCKNNEAYKRLEKLCSEYGNDMYIDYSQSQASYFWETKSKSDLFQHYGETLKGDKK